VSEARKSDAETALAAASAAASAEELFEALGVPFDPRVLASARLHVLRRFGLARAPIDADPAIDAADRLRRYAEALADAHALFTRMTPAEARLFRVLGAAPLVALGRARG
jgi:nitrogenase-stabilizing/protective protein